jgi:TetR/AcrR family transcriptional regulator, regulator of autoinduction and epiphytic fitness
MLMEPSETDGRRARGERTRQRVVEALVDLVEGGELQPSAQRVATHAGVALRTVYHHFEDVEALRATAMHLDWQRHVAELAEIDPDRPLEERITTVVKQRRQLFEAISPMRRASLLNEDSPLIAQGIRDARELLRQRIADVFDSEVRARGADARLFLDALEICGSWQTWNYLRTYMGRRPSDAAKTMEHMLRTLLTQKKR